MEQPDAALMFASAALRRELALGWVDALRRLLVACARLVSPAEAPVRSFGGGGGADGAKRASALFGPALRLLLLAGEPEGWRLTKALSEAAAGAAPAQALC